MIWDALQPYFDSFKFFPCTADKRPAGKNYNRYDSPEGVLTPEEAWARINSGYHVGLLHHRALLVLDVDKAKEGREWRDGLASLRALGDAYHLDFDAIPYVETPSGGRHYYFHPPENVDWSRYSVEIKEHYPGIELRHPGMGDKYVMAPGSGGAYQWVGTPAIYTLPAEVLDSWKRASLPAPPARSVGFTDLDPIRKALDILDPSDYPDSESWREIMMAVHWTAAAASGNNPTMMEEAFALFDQWSDRDDNYAGETAERRTRWESLSVKDRAVTIGTLKYAVKQKILDTSMPDDPTPAERALVHSAAATTVNDIFQWSGQISPVVSAVLAEPVFEHVKTFELTQLDREFLQEIPGDAGLRISIIRSELIEELLEIVQTALETSEAHAQTAWRDYATELVRASAKLRSRPLLDTLGRLPDITDVLVPQVENAFFKRNAVRNKREVQTIFATVGVAARGGMTFWEDRAYRAIAEYLKRSKTRLMVATSRDTEGNEVQELTMNAGRMWTTVSERSIGPMAEKFLRKGVAYLFNSGWNIHVQDLVAGGAGKDDSFLAPRIATLAAQTFRTMLGNYETSSDASFVRSTEIEDMMRETADGVYFEGPPHEAKPKPGKGAYMAAISVRDGGLLFVPKEGIRFIPPDYLWRYPIVNHVDQPFIEDPQTPWIDYAIASSSADIDGMRRPDMEQAVWEQLSALMWPLGCYQGQFPVFYGLGGEGKTTLITAALAALDSRLSEKADTLIAGGAVSETFYYGLAARASEASSKYLRGAQVNRFEDFIKQVTDEAAYVTIDNKYAARRVRRSRLSYIMDTNHVPSATPGARALLRRMTILEFVRPMYKENVPGFSFGVQEESNHGHLFSRMVQVFSEVLKEDRPPRVCVSDTVMAEVTGASGDSDVTTLMANGIVADHESALSVTALYSAVKAVFGEEDLPAPRSFRYKLKKAMAPDVLTMPTGSRIKRAGGSYLYGVRFDLNLLTDDALADALEEYPEVNFQFIRESEYVAEIGEGKPWRQD